MNVEIGIGMHKTEALLLEEFAAKENMTVSGYCRNVLNTHIRAKVGLPVPEPVDSVPISAPDS